MPAGCSSRQQLERLLFICRPTFTEKSHKSQVIHALLITEFRPVAIPLQGLPLVFGIIRSSCIFRPKLVSRETASIK